MFALANDLAHAGKLSQDEWKWWRASNDWYERTLPDPYKVSASLADRTRHPHTFAWFKATAGPFLDRIPGYLALLDAHGVEWMRLHSDDPGLVVYEDDVQVIVAPLVRREAGEEPRITSSLEHVWLRPTTPSDRDFVANVTERAMRRYVEQVFGRWDETEQRRQCDASCHDPACRIVMVGTVAAGLLLVKADRSELFLRRIYLMPEYQRSGIGAHLLRQLVAQADRARKPLRLRALVNNPARRLYERAGFRLTHSTEHHHYFEYVPLVRGNV